MAEVVLNAVNFKKEVLEEKGLVLVDFWATWCGPCKMLAPELEEAAKEYEGTVKIGKVNVDDNMDLAMGYRVASIPMLILFKDGVPVAKSIGYIQKAEIIRLIESTKEQ